MNLCGHKSRQTEQKSGWDFHFYQITHEELQDIPEALWRNDLEKYVVIVATRWG